MKDRTNVTDLIGHTPLLKLEGYGANIYAKLESFNPASCVKERVAQSMIEDAQRAGRINSDTVIIEPTSGNTGIGLAMVAAAKSLKLTLTMPESMSVERRELLKLLGAELVLTDKALGMRGAIAKAEELHSQVNNSIILDQFSNPANPHVHYTKTAPEILEAMGDQQPHILVAGVGTGGTISGIGKAFSEQLQSIEIVAVEPEESPVISGGTAGPHSIQGIGAGFIPKNLDLGLIDRVVKVNSSDAVATLRECASGRGLLVGISSGAALCAAIRLAQEEQNRGKNIVVILPDSAERYLSMLV